MKKDSQFNESLTDELVDNILAQTPAGSLTKLKSGITISKMNLTEIKGDVLNKIWGGLLQSGHSGSS